MAEKSKNKKLLVLLVVIVASLVFIFGLYFEAMLELNDFSSEAGENSIFRSNISAPTLSISGEMN